MGDTRASVSSILLATVTAGLLIVPLLVPAAAQVPFPAPPPDRTTDYADTLFLDSGDCDDGNDSANDLPPVFDCENDWKFTDHRDTDLLLRANPQEFYGVKGTGLNRAWEISTGRPDVVIAVLDSGINWNDRALHTKTYLNRGELPRPQDANGNVMFNPDDEVFDGYDVSGPNGVPDGVFNILDYQHDPRVKDHNGNGHLDPEDLILTFSNGIDEDGNGFIDDIAGWDFWENDNNPFDDNQYGHGTGEAKDSGSDIGFGVGVCPNCMVMHMRVGDSFVADINHFAEATVYAVDNGAAVVQEALGTLNHTSFAQSAVDYAYRNGVLVVASMADEAAGHHMWPAALDHTMPLNSIRTASLPTTQPQSYLYFNGCTNFGGYLYLAIPSTSCSSEAVGRGAGYLGLLVSAAHNAVDRGSMTPYVNDDGSLANFPLSAEEAKQLFRLAADDIDFASGCPGHAFCPHAPADVLLPLAPSDNYATTAPATERYRTVAGWDYATGYGRLNVARLLRAIGIEGHPAVGDREYVPGPGGSIDPYGVGSHPAAAQDRIPPEADIQWPRWWGQYSVRPDGSLTLPDDPASPGAVVIYGRAAANRVTAAGGTFSYVLEYAPHVQGAAGLPAAADSGERSGGPWMPIMRRDGLTSAYEGELGRIPAATLLAALGNQANPFRPTDDPTSEYQPEQHAIRLRLRVIAEAAPGQQALVHPEAVHQKQIDVYPATETVMRDDLGVRITDHADPGLPTRDRWIPRLQGRNAGSQSSPTAHDLTGDGRDELIVATDDGLIHAFTNLATGEQVPGWPVTTRPLEGVQRALVGDATTPVDNAYTRREVATDVYSSILTGSVAVADLDDDGRASVIVADLNGDVHVFEADGSVRPGFPVSTDRSLSKQVGCEEVRPRCDRFEDAPPKKDRFNDRHWGFNVQPAIGDIDPDTPGLEIVIGANDGHVYAWHADGQGVAGWPVALRDPATVATMDPTTRFWTYRDGANPARGTKVLAGPSLGDLTGDGRLEVVIPVNEHYREDPNVSPQSDPVLGVLADELGSGNARLYALYATGTATPPRPETVDTAHVHDHAYLPGWPAKLAILVTDLLPYVGEGSNTQPVLFMQDGQIRIVSASAAGPGYVLGPDGRSALGEDNQGRAHTLATVVPGARAAVEGAVTAVATGLPAILAGVPEDAQRAAVLSALLSGISMGATAVPDTPSYVAVSGMSVASLDGGQSVSVMAGAAGLRRVLDILLEGRQLGAEDHLSMWDPTTGHYLPSAPVTVNDLQFFTHPIAADTTGDGIAEVIQGTAVGDLVIAGASDGNLGARRLFTGGWMTTSATIGPVPGGDDGHLNLLSITREGYLRAHPTAVALGTDTACTARSEWPEYGHDPHNTGHHGVDRVRPGALRDATIQRRPQDRSAAVAFVAPGDNRDCGTVAAYEVRAARQGQGWHDATVVTSTLADGPVAAGQLQHLAVDGIPPQAQHLLVRARDGAGNGSPVAILPLRPGQSGWYTAAGAVLPTTGGGLALVAVLLLATMGARRRRRGD